jgi:hypothetical protein
VAFTGSLGHKVYRKLTHTNLYLNVKSHHHPFNKQALLSTLIHRARSLCDEDSLQAELVFLRDAFKQKSYNNQKIHRCQHLLQPENEPSSVAFLPFVRAIFSRISRVLARHNIKSWACPTLNYPVSSAWSKTTLDKGRQGFTGCPVSAAGSTMGRQAVPWTSG